MSDPTPPSSAPPGGRQPEQAAPPPASSPPGGYGVPPQPGGYGAPPYQQPGGYGVPPQPGGHSGAPGYPAAPGYPPAPGYPAAPGYPGMPGGYPPVPAASGPHQRIPEDQPFVLRPHVTKRLLLMAAPILVLFLILGLPMMISVADADADAAGGAGVVAGTVALLLCLTIPVLVPLAVVAWLTTSGGPLLAVGPDGLWIRTRPSRGQVIFLPWLAIGRIYRRRWALEKMVCVEPRDPRVSANLGAWTAFDTFVQRIIFGTGFTASLNFGDRNEQEIMGAIAHFAAGRCRIE